MITTYLTYGSMFISCVTFAYLAEKKGNHFFSVLVVVILSFVCGCRGNTVGNDTPQYLQIFDNIIRNPNYYSQNIYFEAGFLQLSRLFVLLYPDARFVVICYSVLTFTLIISSLWYYRGYSSFSWSVALFIVGFYSFFQSGIRQGLAIAIVFYALRFLRKRRYLLFILCMIAASSIHTSALVCIVFVFFDVVDWKNLSGRYKILFIMGIVAIPFGLKYVISLLERYFKYFDDVHVKFGIGIPIKLVFLITCFILTARGKNDNSGLNTIDTNNDSEHCYKHIKANNTKETKQYCKYIRESNTKETIQFTNANYKLVPIYYTFGLLLSLTGYVFYTITRISYYFYLFEVIYLSHIVNTKNNRDFIRFGVGLLIAYFYYTYYISGSGYMQVPYYFFWGTIT